MLDDGVECDVFRDYGDAGRAVGNHRSRSEFVKTNALARTFEVRVLKYFHWGETESMEFMSTILKGLYKKIRH